MIRHVEGAIARKNVDILDKFNNVPYMSDYMIDICNSESITFAHQRLFSSRITFE